MTRKEILKIIKAEYPKHCTIATVSPDGKPECAVMGYIVFDDLSLLFNAENTSRKWKNIKNNPFIAVTIGWTADKPFIQYEGVGKLVEKNHPKYKNFEELYFQEHINSLQFKEMPTSRFILVKPRWIRLSDITVKPHRIEELTI